MKDLNLKQMESIEGGSGVGTSAGVACGLAISGFFFGGFPGIITGAIFGPSCAGLSIAAALE